jgi:hypothetical protein
MNWFEDRTHRKYLYLISIPAMALLAFYGVLTKEAVPLWMAFVTAVLSPTLALRNLPDKEDSNVDKS